MFSEFSQNVGQYITDFSMKVVKMLSDGATKILGFIVRMVVTVVSTFFMTFVKLLIGFLVLRITYAAVLAIAIAVFDILPILGTGGILLFWAVCLLVMGKHRWRWDYWCFMSLLRRSGIR